MSKKRKRLMSAKQYREALIKLDFEENGWTDAANITNKGQREAARFLGVNERTSRRWAKGKSPIDYRTGLLLELLMVYGIKPKDAMKVLNGERFDDDSE